MEERNFIPLPAQPSIYSVTNLGPQLLIGAGNNGKCYIYNNSSSALEELPLPDLSDKPADQIDIISIDSFEEDEVAHLAVAYLERTLLGDSTEESRTFYLSIYSGWTCLQKESSSEEEEEERLTTGVVEEEEEEETSKDLNGLYLIGQEYKSFKLTFTPYHIHHVPALQREDERLGNVFLISGSDRSIHCYEPDSEEQTWTETHIKKYFPEIPDSFETIVTRIEIYSKDPSKRITVCGCEDGTIHIFSMSLPPGGTPQGSPDQKSSKVISDYQLSEDSNSPLMIDKTLHYFDGLITDLRFYSDPNGLNENLFVVSALSHTYHYLNVLENNFKKGQALKYSNRFDAVQCLCVADVDSDGVNEIIIGTYACTLLIYKLFDDPEGPNPSLWVIINQKQFPTPIFHIGFANSTFHVVTGSGLHIIHYTPFAGTYAKITHTQDKLSYFT